MDSGEFSAKDMQDYAWKYFSLHADQRMAVFRFFVSISALMTTGMIATFQPNFGAHYIGMGLGTVILVVCYIFWKMDQRTKYLIKNAERALSHFEAGFPDTDGDGVDALRLVSREMTDKEAYDKSSQWNPFRLQLSYSDSFNSVYVVFFFMGVAGFSYSLARVLEM